MRKASQDDSTSITSGIENEFKKPGAGILKNKRNSIKRKVQNFSFESDDAVIEPLLQRDKERVGIGNQSAKLLLSKTKTESSERGNDKDKLLAESKIAKPSTSDVPGITDKSFLGNGINESLITKSIASTTVINNNLNTNVLSTHDGPKGAVIPNSQILVEIDGSKPSGYNPSPLIFTTAKIHTDGNIKQMEPVQMTPVPILSIVEGKVMRAETVSEHDTYKEGSSRKDKISSLVFTKPCTSDMKAQPSVSNLIGSHIPFSGESSNVMSVSSISNQIKEQNLLNKTSTTSSTIPICAAQLTSVTNTSKVISYTDKLKNIALVSTAKENDGQQIKEEQSTKTLLPQSSMYSSSETANLTILDSRFQSVPTISEKTTNSVCASNKFGSKDINMDLNRNIPSVADKDSKNPVTTNIISSVNINPNSDTSSKIQISNLSLSNKLPQCQNATSDDPCDLNMKTVLSFDNFSLSDAQNSKDSSASKISSLEGKPLQTNIPDGNVTKSVNDNNVTVSNETNSNIKITATTASIQPTVCKPSVISSTAKKSAVSNITPITSGKSTVLAANPSISSTIPTITNPKSSTVSNVKSSSNVKTISSVSKPINNTKAVTSGTTANVSSTVKVQTIPNTKSISASIPTPTTSTTKISTVSTMKSTVSTTGSHSVTSTKPYIVSSTKSGTANATPHTSAGKSITSSSTVSTTSAIITKPSTVTTMKPSSIKINTSSATKTAKSALSTTASTTSTKPTVSTTKQSGLKSAGLHKDGKSSKA